MPFTAGELEHQEVKSLAKAPQCQGEAHPVRNGLLSSQNAFTLEVQLQVTGKKAQFSYKWWKFPVAPPRSQFAPGSQRYYQPAMPPSWRTNQARYIFWVAEQINQEE